MLWVRLQGVAEIPARAGKDFGVSPFRDSSKCSCSPWIPIVIAVDGALRHKHREHCPWARAGHRDTTAEAEILTLHSNFYLHAPVTPSWRNKDYLLLSSELPHLFHENYSGKVSHSNATYLINLVFIDEPFIFLTSGPLDFEYLSTRYIDRVEINEISYAGKEWYISDIWP